MNLAQLLVNFMGTLYPSTLHCFNTIDIAVPIDNILRTNTDFKFLSDYYFNNCLKSYVPTKKYTHFHSHFSIHNIFGF